MKKELSFEKIRLGSIEKCYAALGVELEGEPCLFFGGEGPGSVRAFRGERFEQCDVIWEGGGGTMSIVPFPGRGGVALISRGFYSMVDSEGSSIELVRYRDGAFSHETIAELSYLHRFDAVLAPDGARYIVAATLHGGKADKEDWSKPGHLYIGELPESADGPFRVELVPLPGDYYVNHGFCKGEWEGRDAAFTSSREGVFVTLPPDRRGGAWRTERLLDFPVSDIAVCDIDGDGEREIAALLPFHGNQFKIFHRDGGGYREVFAYPVENDFYHAVISGRIRGERMFAGGARKLAADLFLVRWDGERGGYFTQQLEAGSGPSNLAILNAAGGDYLLSANRMIFEAAAYRF
ncbi:MAG: hypothetical protein GX647_11985 [Clostridiales bacterium]|jgi:hypothetical protein|nr:hypothetical protein [Clostridiales bacterium]OPZ70074.1 MAG: hypothetical protein BWY81_00106 [Firmicutes bacterium ADurb.Bin467]